MKSDQDFKKIFAAHRADIPDEGFSERATRRLPERKSMLPHAVMAVFAVAGLGLTFAIQGIAPLLNQIDSLVASLNQAQIPSPVSVVTYIGMAALAAIIGYSVSQADTT